MELIDRLPRLFGDNKFDGSCLVAALQGVRLAMVGHTIMRNPVCIEMTLFIVSLFISILHQGTHGGKLLLFECCLPTLGPGALKSREEHKSMGTDKEKTLFSPQDPLYAKIASEYSSCGIGVDLFLMANSFVDMATLGEI
jgi:hypothetical protein